jgi:fumarate hydratase class I
MSELWTQTLLELIRRTSCDLPTDVEQALRKSLEAETSDTARATLTAMLENVALARDREAPICQDTGTPTFSWHIPRGADAMALEKQARTAIAEATRRGWLRRNTLEALSGKSQDDNVAEGTPVCHFVQEDREDVVVWLLQKGGGSENVSTQYSLPDASLNAGRDLEGVRACLLDAVWKAQGHGCAPGVLGVCVGSDRAGGFTVAKEQLLRPLDDRAAEPELAVLEERVLRDANKLGIGPMGLSGATTLLGVKIAARPRVPASFFVTVAYMCWACRRRGVRAQTDGKMIEFLG